MAALISVIFNLGCNNAMADDKVGVFFKDVTEMAKKGDRLAIDFATIPLGDFDQFTTDFVDENSTLTMIYRCDRVCINSTIKLFDFMIDMKEIKCQTSFDYSVKLYYIEDGTALTPIYFDTTGTHMFYEETCFQLPETIDDMLITPYAIF